MSLNPPKGVPLPALVVSVVTIATPLASILETVLSELAFLKKARSSIFATDLGKIKYFPGHGAWLSIFAVVLSEAKASGPIEVKFVLILSEFELLDADGKVIPAGKFELVYDGSGGDDNFGDGEKPGCAVDGNLDTKWLDFRAAHDRSAAHRSAVWIQFKFAEPTKLSGYRWYTANDDEDRDPRDWRLLGSNDGVNWVVVDKVEDFEAASDRKKLAFTARFGL